MTRHRSARPKVLHVDDDEDIRELVKLSLETAGGLYVTQFASGLEAIANIDKIDADIFLLDIMMPELTGPETLQRLRSVPRFSATPAVFLTAKGTERELQTLMQPGVAAIITKPFDPLILPKQIVRHWRSFVPDTA